MGAGTGNGLEFEYIIAAVVGGTLLTGGYGSAFGAAIGAFDAERVPDQPITVVATDLDLAWRVDKAVDDFTVELVDAHTGQHSPVTPTDPSELFVAGESNELVPWLWGRATTNQLTTTGDLAAIDAWNLSANI